MSDEKESSQSSDEKMDTASESLVSTQNTPNSIKSCEFDEKEESVLRLQQPDVSVLRLSQPLHDKNNHNPTLVLNMAKLKLNDITLNTPKSILTSTTSHPLMLGSPDAAENYPDVVPKKRDEDLSLSSVEDNHLDFYRDGPQRNTSKNNLYFSDHGEVHTSLSPPDVARSERRKISAFIDSDYKSGQKLNNDRDNSFLRYTEERFRSLGEQCRSTPKMGNKPESSGPMDVAHVDEVHLGVVEWCESPTQLKSVPNFELPIEMSSNIALHSDLDSPDVMSSSTQGDHSSYQATLDPYNGSVSLLHSKVHSESNSAPRRRIVALVEMEQDSSDSELECSIRSDDLPNDEEVTQNGCSRRNSFSGGSSPIPEYSAAEERHEERAWLKVPMPGGGVRTCDMKVIEPYKRVVSHGGYEASGAAIIVFSACHLPHSARVDYNYVMDNLFLYVLWTLERLVTDDYVLVYLHGSASKSRMPTFHWLHECYKLIDRRLRKSLKHLYLVHPTFWIKTIVVLCKTFVSTKFFRKISYINNLNDLMDKVPVEPIAIPDLVREYDSVK